MGRRVVHTVGDLDSRWGGPSVVIPKMVSELATDSEFKFILVSQIDSSRMRYRRVDSGFASTLSMACRSSGLVYWGFGFLRAFIATALFRSSSVIHDHGFWRPSNFLVRLFSIYCDVPLVVQPHGSLSVNALRERQGVKTLYLRLIRWQIKKCKVFIASSDAEATDIRRVFPMVDVCTIPYGIDEGYLNTDVGQYFLFLGRIDLIKGLDDMFESIERCETSEQLHIKFVGWDDGYVDELRSKYSSVFLRHKFEFLGPVSGAEKERLLKRALALVVPSKSENFGYVVLEAIRYGTPVVFSKNVPWPLLDCNGGFMEDSNTAAFGERLIWLLGLEDKQYLTLRKQAFLYSKKLTWERCKMELNTVYSRILMSKG